MTHSSSIVIFGNGEIAELAKYYFETDSCYRIKAFVVDDEFSQNTHFCGLPIISLSDFLSDESLNSLPVHVALSFSKLNLVRKNAYLQLKSKGITFVSYVSTKAFVADTAQLGCNSFVLEGNCIQSFVQLGENVMLWSGNHVGHRTKIASHTYVSSHVCISGFCKIGESNFLGVNSSIKDFTTTGNDCIVGMGVALTTDLASGSSIILEQNTRLVTDPRITHRLARNLTS